MRKSKIVLFLLIIVIVIVAIFVNSKNKNRKETVEPNQLKNDANISTISVSEQRLKKAIEKTENGIEISNVKINSFDNNVIDIKLTVTNKTDIEKRVKITVSYLDNNSQKIGNHVFEIEILNGQESRELESAGYIEDIEVNKAQLELEVVDLSEPENEDELREEEEKRLYEAEKQKKT